MKALTPALLCLPFLITLNPEPAQAYQWQNFRPSQNVDDRRRGLQKEAEETDRLREKLIEAGRLAAKRGHIFGCATIDRIVPKTMQLGTSAKASTPAVTLISQKSLAAEIKLRDPSSVNACDGSAQAQFDVANKAYLAAQGRLAEFERQTVPVRGHVDTVKKQLKSIDPSITEARCRQPTEAFFRELDDYIISTNATHSYLSENVGQAQEQKMAAERGLASCGKASVPAVANASDPAPEAPLGSGRTMLKSRMKSEVEKYDHSDLAGMLDPPAK